MCFTWLDDKRQSYLKDEEMYPDLHALPLPTMDPEKIIIETKQLEDINK